MAKRKSDPYGTRTAWYKIKNPTYTQAEGRRELFERVLGRKAKQEYETAE